MVENGLANGTLTPKQEAAALALASGKSLAAASKAAGAGVTTIKRWLREQPLLACRVTELRVQMTERALGLLVDNMVSASETLGYLSRKGKSEMVRLSAARSVLEFAVRLRESIDLETRLAALERIER